MLIKLNCHFKKKNLLKEVFKIFRDHKYTVFLVGGAVRSLVMNKDPKDFDLTTNALPEQVIKIFERTLPTGIQHGTVTILFKGLALEVTTFRSEGKYLDMRHPSSVNFKASLEEDLSRRDFTINSLALDILRDELFDYHEGIKDINNKVIRAIGDPLKRFQEDSLRTLRACRLSAELNFEIEETTIKAIKKTFEQITNLSAERIYKEFFRIVSSDYPLRALHYLKLFHFFRKFMKINDFDDKNWKNLEKIQVKTQEDYLSRLLIILSPFSQEKIQEFFKHLKFPRSPQNLVFLILTLKEKYPIKMLLKNEKLTRKFLSLLNRKNVSLFLKSESAFLSKKDFQILKTTIKSNIDFPLSLKELKISGNDLIEEGFSGKEIGDFLSKSLDWVLENPSLNQREILLSKIKTLNSNSLD